MHGGKNGAGLANPNFKTGRYSQHIPTRMLERYAESATDPALLSLREEITLVDARLADVLTRVDTGESGTLWSKAREVFKELRKGMAMGADGAPIVRAALDDLDGYLGRGVADWHAWSEIHKLLNQRTKLVESERKAIMDARNVMTNEQALVMVEALIQTVRVNVKDPAALAAISAALGRILGRSPVGPSHRGDETE